MPNNCEVKKKIYSKEDYWKIKRWISSSRGDSQILHDKLFTWYEDTIAKSIESAIANNLFVEDWTMESVSGTTPIPTPVNIPGAKDADVIYDSLLSYYLDKEDLLSARDHTATKFFEDVISRVLYNRDKGAYLNPTTDSVNKALYEYKLELLKQLWDYTGISHQEEIDGNNLTLAISRTLNDYLSKNKNDSSDNLWDNYVILTNFSKLLEDYAPFIKTNAAFKNTNYQDIDMYIWDPSGSYRESWTTSEDSDISKTVSPLIRMLADYFTTEKGIPIGFKTYNIAMSTVAIWIHENSNINAEVQDMNRGLRKDGLNADFGKMIDLFIQYGKPTEGLRDVLQGIKKHIFNKYTTLPQKIQQAFANQFFITAKYAYVAYRQNFDEGDKHIRGQYLEDSFVDIRLSSLMKRIRNNVWMYQQDPELFGRFLKDHGLTVNDDNDVITITFDKRYGKSFTITLSNENKDTISVSKAHVDPKTINNSAFIELIQDLLDETIPEDYNDILRTMDPNGGLSRISMFGTFINPIAILLGAANDADHNSSLFRYDYKGDLKTYNFKSSFAQAAAFESIKDGIQELNVLKNGEGNNLPVYQLAPAVFDIFTLIDELIDIKDNQESQNTVKLDSPVSKDPLNPYRTISTKTVYPNNLFVAKPGLLKKMVARSDIKVGDKVKSSDKLSAGEVGSLAIFNDFYQNLMINPNEDSPFKGCILLQPITYSDKKSHFLPLIDLQKLNDLILDGKSVNAWTVFKNIVSSKLSKSERQKSIDVISDRIIKCRGDKAKRQIWNQYLRFYSVFFQDKSYDDNKDLFVKKDGTKLKPAEAKLQIITGAKATKTTNKIQGFDEDAGFKYIVTILNHLNEFQDPIGILRAMFKTNGTLLNEDFDILQLKDGTLQANESLYFTYKTFNRKDKRYLDRYFKRQQFLLALDLIENGVWMDIYEHPEIKSYCESFAENNGDYLKKDWYDDLSGIMKIARFFKDGKEIFPTQAKIESDAFRQDRTITVQLNPMIEGYFYANALFGEQINQIELGGTEGYIPKLKKRLKLDATDPIEIEAVMDDLQEVFASRLANEFKRSTYEGAIKRRFTNGLKFGVSSKIWYAVVEDSEPLISTLRGSTEGQVAQDGSGFTMPTLHYMQNESLVDSPVGFVKKTIAGWVDPRTGTQNHFKWAETVLTMDMRQRSDYADRMFKKAYRRSDISSKFKGISDLSVYYNPNGKVYSHQEHDITETDYIYRYDVDNGYWYKLLAVKNDNGTIKAAWRMVDKNGNDVLRDGKPFDEVIPTKIKTLYDISEAFGGRFTFEKSSDGTLVTSEKVHKILYHIQCMNDMKEDMTGYIVNHSSAKAGAVNMNSSSIFDNDDEELNTSFLGSFGIGVQMDADHEMDFASVTEMSQMISLLTQGGYNVELVNQAYEDIGRVAAEAMRDILAYVNSNDTAIYKIIGKALLDTFDSGTKEELGLAQAFIRNAQNAILKETGKDNIILPYSAESIRGSFIAAVTSLINKRGIRRKYAGFGAVQVPAEGIMQQYTIDGIDHNYLGMRDAIRPILKEKGLTWEQVNTQIIINGELNPFIKPIDQKAIEWEDTIVIQNKTTGQFSEPIKITTGPLFDKYRNLIDPNQVAVYRWETKPKELAQNDLRIKIQEEEYGILGTREFELSEFDIDSVRASFYIDELIAYKKNPKNDEWLHEVGRKRNVIMAAIKDSDLSLRNGSNVSKIIDIEDFSVDFLTNLKKQCITKSQEYFNNLSHIIKTGKFGELPIQMASINDNILRKSKITQKVSPEIRNITAKVVLGRRHFSQYLLRKGDRLSDIKKQGSNFFYNRLIEQTGTISKVRSLVNPEQYDGIVHLGNGDNILVLVGAQGNNLDNYNEKTHDFVISDKAVSYKGKVLIDDSKLKGLCTVKDLSFYSCIAENGETINVIHVPDYKVFDRLSSSSAILDSQYNYNERNWLSILQYHYADNFNNDGSLKSNIQIEGFDLPTVNGVIGGYIEGYEITQDYINNPDNIWNTLNRRELAINKRRLEKKSKLMYRNFMQQLQYIQTRIPAQAMQSTMNIEVVDFADTDMNYIWVPKMLMKLQGSDLDIDKAYCMGYDVDDSGNIYALSDLINNVNYNAEDVLLLPPPTGGQVRINMSDADMSNINPVNIDFTSQMYELLTATQPIVLKSIINLFKDNKGKTINLVIDWNALGVKKPKWFDDIIKDVNIHEASTRSDSEKESALRNQVLTAARKIMNDPASQLNAYTPIAMDEPRAAAKLNTALGSKEKEMTLDNGMSIAIMQKQNMSGKEVIAMTATGIKSYFIVTTYFNTLASRLEKLISEYGNRPSSETANEIASILNEITFDGKLDSSSSTIRTFANVNFFGIKQILNKLIENGWDGILTYDPEEVKTNAANSSFNKYAQNGVLNLKNLIEDLDYRSNGNTWVISADKTEDVANKLSKALGEKITPQMIEQLISSDTLLDEFLWAHPDQEKIITNALRNLYEYFVVNAPDSLSALLSAATDNAKELILDKLNATSKFADIYVTLLSQGVPFRTIAKMMTNRAFGIVAKYAQDSIFDPNTSWFGIEKALSFVLNEGQLDTIQRGLFEAFLLDNQGIDNITTVDPHRHNGFYNILRSVKINGTDNTVETLIHDALLRSGITDEDIYQYLVAKDSVFNDQNHKYNISKALDRIVSDKNYGDQKWGSKVASWQKAIVKAILDLFNDTINQVIINNESVSLADRLKFLLLDNLQTSLGPTVYPKIARSIKRSDDPDDMEPDMEPDIEPADDEFEEMYYSSRTSSSNGFFKGNIRRKELLNIYRYVSKYFIPKTELWNALSEEDKEKAKSDFSKLSTEVLYAAKEMKMLGSFGSINRGLKPKDFDEYKFIKNINKFINRAYIRNGNIQEEFDLIRFITETEPKENEEISYHDRHVAYYETVKSAINILKAIDYTGNFREMFKYIATNRSMIENSIAVKLERRVEDQLLRSVQKRKNIDPTDETKGISLASTTILNDKEFRTLSQYIRDLIVLNFFMGRHDLKMIVPKGQRFYDTDGNTAGEPTLKNPITTNKPITLHTVTDLATFKHLMDWYIIPRLKTDPRFKGNTFLKNLIRDRIIDEKSKESIIFYKVNVPLINIKDSPKAKKTYGKVLSDFNELLYCPIDQGVKIGEEYGIGDWTIGNLFYMYNLIVNKDKIGDNAMTRLFEDLVSSGNKLSLASEYYTYISDLDKGNINILNDDGTINQETFVFNINDLKYRLSGSENSKNKFGVSQKTDPRNPKIVTEVQVFDSLDKDSDKPDDYREVSDDRTYISDFILNLPFSTKIGPFKKVNDDFKKDFNEKSSIEASSQTVFESLANEIANTYGKQIPMEMLSEEEIREEFKDRDDVDTLAQSSGFIINGNIYLNTSQSYRSLDAPMHELMHFICAAMKFSDDPKVRQNYYKLLDWAADWLNKSVKDKDLKELQDKLIKKKDEGEYRNRHMSDIKEEILVTLLAREFKYKFGGVWGDSKEISQDQIHAMVKMTIAKIFNAEEIQNVDFNDLGNASLLSVLKRFSSQALLADTNLSTMLMYNQEIAEIKNFLVKHNLIEMIGDCL